MKIDKKVLVTGATGFVGACLAHRLVESGEDIHLLIRKKSDMWRIKDISEKVKLYEADLSNRKQTASAIEEIKPDVIFHLATYGAYTFQKELETMVATNVQGTINLVDACAKNGFERFINVSSSSEYGVKDHPMQETDLLEPNNLYGVTKAAATHYCQHMARENGLPIATFRIFAAYGPWEDARRFIPTLILSCLRNENPRLSYPDSVRDFIFIDDVCDALTKAASTDKVNGQILNLGTGVQLTLGDVADSIIRLTGAKVKPEWGARPTLQKEPKTWMADMTKTKSVLGWMPKYDSYEGFTKDIEWFKEYLPIYS